MKPYLLLTFLSLVAILLPGCDFIGSIFQTGIGVGIFIAVAILVLILLVGRIGRRRP